MNSIDSDVFFVEQLSSESNPQRNNSGTTLNSTELSGIYRREMSTLSSVTFHEQDIVTLNDDSNDPTVPYGFGVQQPIVPPSLNDVKVPPNPFSILATRAVVQPNSTQHDDNCSPQSPEPSESSSI